MTQLERDKQLQVELTGFAIHFLQFSTTFGREVELMGFATIDTSKSARSTNSIFTHNKHISANIENNAKKNNATSKIWS